ncbi:uncharacterized protein MONOS_17259 [Monocercomonoides exilis]|uniref:uncharacterized protein n=1 Tax=Monocercomonoides exilis TaxID=2049356 RepID=UPI003559A2C1|nr:hypothetical protein MONOS_17259 [Monocercomonoides exilis]
MYCKKCFIGWGTDAANVQDFFGQARKRSVFYCRWVVGDFFEWSLRDVLFRSRELSEEDVIEVYFFAIMAIFESDKARSRRRLEVAGGMKEK